MKPFIFFLAAFAQLLFALPLRAAVPLPERRMTAGDSYIWTFPGMKTVAIEDPTIADVLPLSDNALLVNAKSPGRTTLVVMESKGRRAFQIDVILDNSIASSAAAETQREIDLPTVTARAYGNVVLLQGTVDSTMAQQRADAIAGVYAPNFKDLLLVEPSGVSLAQTYVPLINQAWQSKGIEAQEIDSTTIALTGSYTPPAAAPDPSADEPALTDDLTPIPTKFTETGRQSARTTARTVRSSGLPVDDPLSALLQSLPPALHVVDLVQIGDRPVRQVLVRAKVIDIDRNSVQNLGIQWGTLSLTSSRSGQTYALQPQPILFGQSPGNLFNNPLSGGGALNRFYPLGAELSALIAENKARVLSEPSLLVRDGAVGSILVGGEIPVPVAQSASGFSGATVSVEYKPYGVRLQVQPTIVGQNTIQLAASPEVSDLDYGNGVSFNGLSIPALTVRQASTTLQMQDGQTLAIGGLYSSNDARHVERIPLLSQIPVIGNFFRYTQNSRQESDLLILLSVQIVAPTSPDIQAPAAGSPLNPPIAQPNVPPGSFSNSLPLIRPAPKPLSGTQLPPISLPEQSAPAQEAAP